MVSIITKNFVRYLMFSDSEAVASVIMLMFTMLTTKFAENANDCTWLISILHR